MSKDNTVSVSRGVFVFKNKGNRSRKSRSNISKMLSQNLWYQEYDNWWSVLNETFEDLNRNAFASLKSELFDFLKHSHQTRRTEIPTATLLTGINMPDHEAQFSTLKSEIEDNITPHVACLNSQDCGNLKFLMDNMILQFLNSMEQDNLGEEDEQTTITFKKSNLSLALLQSWYQDLYCINDNKEMPLLVIIIPDFESFNIKVLQNFILILAHYLEHLPFVLVFGIATTISTFYTSFPYHVTAKIEIQIFECESSILNLNKMLESFFLSAYCPFQLGGNVFDLFTEIFLYYDFSVKNFMQNIKFAMMEHFCYGNAMALCQIEKKEAKYILECFSHDDCENVRHLMSFRKMVESESYENRIKLLTDDVYFKDVVFEKVTNLQKYIKRLHIFLKCVHVMVEDLPGFPLGKNLREIYVMAVTKTLTDSSEYKEAFKLLEFQSKEELQTKLEKIVKIMEQFINTSSKKTVLKEFWNGISQFIQLLNDTECNDPEELVENTDRTVEPQILCNLTDRKSLKEVSLSKNDALLFRSKQKSISLNKYEKLRKEILEFLTNNFKLYLLQPTSLPLHEIFFFVDLSIKDKIIGTHRTAIHNALNDPHYYLQCNCCQISTSQSVRPTMPDICIAYKLHLEWGKMINLYDWLLAFLCVVDPKEDDTLDEKSKKVVVPELQARFTQAIAELEYLGFVKSSKRKTDHVTRLTWGG
ncbi:hypothetical protein ABEB36_002482 [Hypothenemus hampei]|uniref:Origin recognition complex subunit 3 n=1 Tax=Hypothenemus hampei TaxID=57062 RepID=A0ABD1F8I5_HYPHA